MAETAYIPRLKQQYQDVLRGELVKEFGYANPMQVPRLDKVVLNMGVGEGVADSKKVTAAAADLGADRRAEAGDHQGAQVDRHLQAARGHADRRQGDAAPEPHVRVRRPAGEHRAAARARLPRAEPEELRRPGQFHPRAEGAHHLSRRSITTRSRRCWGMDIVVCTTAPTDDEARALLKHLNFPFRS